MQENELPKKKVKIGVDFNLIISIVLTLVIMIAVPKVYVELHGWYDNSTGPSENYQTALDNKDATLASLYDFQFEVNGYYFSLPMKYSDMQDMGFYGYTGGRNVVDAGDTLYLGVWFVMGEPNEESINPLKGTNSIWTNVHNYGSEQANLEDCTIDGIKIGEFIEKGNFNAILPRGIKINESTSKDVKKAYGNPKVINKDGNWRYEYYYELSGHSSSNIILYFNKDDVLYMADFYNRTESYGE